MIVAIVQRNILLFVLGVWCGCSVFMWLVATQNFGVAKALQEAPAPGFAQTTSGLDAEAIRLATRHQAGEVNRLFFNGWGMVQIPIALIAFGLACSSKSGRTVLVMVGVMLVIVVAFQLYVVPETIRLGRVLDFIPRDPVPPEDAPFWRLHHTYTGLDMFKFLLGLAAMGLLVRKS
jgi:hypothetical protein